MFNVGDFVMYVGSQNNGSKTIGFIIGILENSDVKVQWFQPNIITTVTTRYLSKIDGFTPREDNV